MRQATLARSAQDTSDCRFSRPADEIGLFAGGASDPLAGVPDGDQAGYGERSLQR